MKKVLLVIGSIIFIFLILIVGFKFFNKIVSPQKIHYHAGFIVFKDDKKINFSDYKYMYEKPCTINGKENEENENDQLEKAHLHDSVGDVVHIERKGATWEDFFQNIKYPLGKNASSYINGKKIQDFQKLEINPDDSLVVFIGNNNINKDLKQAPGKKYIEKMGSKSKTCGD
jgi:hypothetical protein